MTASEQPPGWRGFIPISFWLASYEKGYLAVDLVAALTVWALVVPEAMAYATLAGMPPETGLYAALVAPLAYAIFGTSRQLIVGPSSTVAVMSAAVILPLAAGGDTQRFVELTTALAILVGAFFIIAGLVKLGFIADFMSRPVMDGFIVGLAMTIAAGQLTDIFGIEASGDNFFQDIGAVLFNLDETVVATLAIGAASLVLLFLLERVMPRIPAALVVVGLSIAVVSVFELWEEGVHIIGDIPAGLPSLGWPQIGIGDWIDLMPGALGIVIVGFAESVAAARTYARKNDYKVDANQEMVAIGASNAVSGLFGAFTVDGSLSRTAAADQAGQKSQFASIALSAAVFITILFLTGLFENLAEATLAAIIIHAVWHLIDFEKITRYLHIRKDDFWAGLAAVLGVLFFDILTGLLIAVGLSFLILLARVSRPQWNILGRTGEEASDDVAFQALDAHPDAETFPGLVMIRFDADLFFGNANVFADDIRSALEAAESRTTVVLIDAESINDIDSTAIGVVRDLRDEMDAAGIELWAARVKSHVSDMLVRFAGHKSEHVYPSVRAAVQAFQDRDATADDRRAEEASSIDDGGTDHSG